MNEKSLDETVTLWKNQIGNPSELLLGTKYFSIKSSMIELVEGMAGSGILDLIISNCVAGVPFSFQGITVGAIANLVITLEHIFKAASDLEDHDFVSTCKQQHTLENIENLRMMIWFIGSLMNRTTSVICTIQHGIASTT